MVELGLAGGHLAVLRVFRVLAPHAPEHVQLLAHAARHGAEPSQAGAEQRGQRSSRVDRTEAYSGSVPS